MQHLDMQQFQLSFRTFDFQFDNPFKHSIIQSELSIRIFNPNIQFEYSIQTFDYSIQTFNSNVQSKHSIPTFNLNIQFKHSIIQFEHSIQTFDSNVEKPFSERGQEKNKNKNIRNNKLILVYHKCTPIRQIHIGLCRFVHNISTNISEAWANAQTDDCFINLQQYPIQGCH